MDTVETLRVGGEGEREQRIVSLTAQLAAAKTGEAVLEARAGELLAEAEARQVCGGGWGGAGGGVYGRGRGTFSSLPPLFSACPLYNGAILPAAGLL